MKSITSVLMACGIAWSVVAQAEDINPNAPTRTSNEIQAVFNTIKDDVSKLINDRRKDKPDMEGRIDYKVTVEVDGKVSEVLVQNTTLKDEELEQSILDKIKSLDFGKPSGPPNKMTFVFPVEVQKEAKKQSPVPMKIEKKYL